MSDYFSLAKTASLMSTHPKYQMGAVIVNKKPVSVGANLYKTHPKYANGEEEQGLSIHAEVKAIISCPRNKLKGSEMWIYRENKNGDYAMAKPCENCRAIIEDAGIKRVYYTTNESYEVMEF